MNESLKHSEHDHIREEVSSWYRTSAPELGYHLVRRRFGFYRHRTDHTESEFVIVDSLTPDEVPEFLDEPAKPETLSRR